MSFIVSRFNNFHITSPLQLSLQIQLRSYKTQLIVIALKKRTETRESFHNIFKHHVRLSVCIDDLLLRSYDYSMSMEAGKKFFVFSTHLALLPSCTYIEPMIRKNIQKNFKGKRRFKYRDNENVVSSPKSFLIFGGKSLNFQFFWSMSSFLNNVCTERNFSVIFSHFCWHSLIEFVTHQPSSNENVSQCRKIKFSKPNERKVEKFVKPKIILQVNVSLRMILFSSVNKINL